MIMLPPNQAPTFSDKCKILNALLSDYAITPAQLGTRWGYSVQRLANARANGTSPLPFWQTPTGGVRYWMRDVIAAELAGARGPLSLDRIEQELMFLSEVSAEAQTAIMGQLRAVQGELAG